jgi:hypothetical protein
MERPRAREESPSVHADAPYSITANALYTAFQTTPFLIWRIGSETRKEKVESEAELGGQLD